MKNSKLNKGQLIAIIIVIAVMVIAVAVGGVLIFQSLNESTGETSPTETTQVQTTNTTQVGADDDKPDSTQQVTAQDTTPQETKEDTPENKPDNKEDEQNNTTPTEETDDVIEEVKIEDDGKEATGKNVLKVNGVKCKVGDTITVVLNLKTPKTLINFQGATYFDSDFLKCLNADMNVGGMLNVKSDSILYNGSEITKGFNFTGYGTMYVAEFKVLKKGNTTITNTFEVLSDMDMQIISESDCTSDLVIYN